MKSIADSTIKLYVQGDIAIQETKRNFCTQKGQGFVEYGLVLFLVAIVVLIALFLFGQGLKDYYEREIMVPLCQQFPYSSDECPILISKYGK